ncbi:MAG: 3-hydroxyacyl-CoA dehydrogenase [Betaproteobacteria bacterium]|nr:3-hydroxyacyl-CoA dehydrogenase [Betaproteobacteria bacterium]
MPIDATKSNLIVGVVGTGTMGRGIAQIAAQTGIETRMFDANAGAVDAARASIADVLAKQVEKGRLTKQALDDTMARLKGVASLSDLAPCDIVIEAIIERLDAKRDLFKALEAIVRADAIIASNTSSLSVTAMAAACAKPGRVAGYHFFNPVPLMKLVEVVDGTMTEPATCDALSKLATRMGHTPVRAKDMPGFIVNHAGRAFVPEALRIISEGIAEFHDVDKIMKDVAGFRMGPFELCDLVGFDVSHAVMESIYHQFYEEARFRITPLATQRVAAGLFGRKTKRGFYDYSSGVANVYADAPMPRANKLPVWVSKAEPAFAEKVRSAFVDTRVEFEGGAKPSAYALIVVTPLGQDTTTAVLEQGLDPRRTVAIDGLFPLVKRRTLMTSPATAPEYRDAAHAMLAAESVAVSVIKDSPGFVAPRIVAQIISIACDIAQQRIASPQDIDLAVRLGLNYPDGPLAMGDTLGPKRVLNILENLYAFYGDPRYRPSAWLKRRAMLGLSLLTED